MTLTFDAIAQAGPRGIPGLENPHSMLAKLRASSPVLPLGEVRTGIPGAVLISRYDDVRATLRDDPTFSSAIMNDRNGTVFGPTLIGFDGNEHSRHRKRIAPALSPRALRGRFQPVVSEIARRHVARLVKRGRADLERDFTFSFPMAVFVRLLNLPDRDADQIHRWGADLTLVSHDPKRAIAASQSLAHYLEPIVGERRCRPGNDLISDIATADADGAALGNHEVVSFLRLLVTAGAETTYHLLGTCLFVLLDQPRLMERVRRDRSLVPRVVREALRWEAPIAVAVRQATRETTIAGVPIAPGTLVMCHLGSANRDEAHFDRPEEFRLDRAESDDLAFGFGRHYCAGSRLALMEAEIGLHAVLERLPGCRFEPGASARIVGWTFRGPDRLPVEFETATR